MTKTHEFMAPADMLEGEEVARAIVNPAALTGTWSNCDKATRGLVKMVIGISGGGISVHGYGACTPTPCDWGTAPGMVYAENVTASAGMAFTAHYKFPFKETIVAGRLDAGALVVETFDRFTDGSGRSSYCSRCYMYK